jgi:hypothetical protein
MKTKTNLVIYEQGDVVLIKRETAIEGKKLKTNVLQEGEHTGHAHRFTSGTAAIFGAPSETKGEPQRLSVKVTKQATLTHEEHLPVTIEEGEYEVRIVRQKDPFTKLVSRVID